MSTILKYILACCLFLSSFNGISKDILIDAGFSSTDIYNTLTCSKEIVGKDLKFDLLLKNNSGKEQQLYLSFINPTIDKIMIFNNRDTVILGDLIPFTKRVFKHTNFVYPVFLNKDSIVHLHIAVTQKPLQRLNFRLNLATENTFIKTTNHDNFFNGIFYGIFFMYLLLLICFYIFSKSNFFTIYLMINFFMLLLFLLFNGTGYQFFWFYSAAIQKYISVIAVIGYLTAHIFFIRTFFSMQFRSFTRYLLRIFLLVVLIFGILLLAQSYNRSYGFINASVYYLLVNGVFIFYGLIVLILCVYTYLESGSREIIWVLIGMLFHMANWMLFINNEFAAVKWINEFDNFKLFTSNIYIPQLNYFITMLEIFVVTVFISINYHKLIRQNNLSTQRLEFLQKRNINTFVLGQEEEREIITNEIDAAISKDIEQLKTVLSAFHLQNDEKKVIPAVLNEIDKTLADINNITGNYVAPDMQQMQLTELITTATDKLYNEVNTHYDFTKIPEHFKLNEVANINLYRIFQEISNNTIKHSHANNVTITAIKDNKSLQLKISDDGIGFSVINDKNKGIGLMNIESRMNSLNGNFYLMSNEKKGSTIHLIMSLKDIT